MPIYRLCKLKPLKVNVDILQENIRLQKQCLQCFTQMCVRPLYWETFCLKCNIHGQLFFLSNSWGALPELLSFRKKVADNAISTFRFRVSFAILKKVLSQNCFCVSNMIFFQVFKIISEIRKYVFHLKSAFFSNFTKLGLFYSLRGRSSSLASKFILG